MDQGYFPTDFITSNEKLAWHPLSGLMRFVREKFALIVNTHGRKIRRDPALLQDLRTLFGNRGPFYATQSPQELPEIIKEIRNHERNTIFICGGDGTLRQTLSQMVSIYQDAPLPRIAPLKGGTMNVIASGSGIWLGPRHQLRRVLNRYEKKLPPRHVKKRLLQVNDHYGFIFGVGGFSRFIDYYRTHPDPNPLWALQSVIKTMGSALIHGPFSQQLFPPFSAEITFSGGEPNSMMVTNISGASVVDNGFGSKPYYGANAENGTFGLLVLKGKPRKLFFHLSSFFQGKPVRDPEIFQLPQTSVCIKLTEPLAPMLDGDILEADTTFHLKTGPLFRLLVQ